MQPLYRCEHLTLFPGLGAVAYVPGQKNPRFATYCPFCPASTRILPPSYAAEASSSAALPPEYTTSETKGKLEAVDDVIHFIRATDTLPGLALLYNVPPIVLRSHNRLWSDHLLVARSAIAIPASHYQGESHSPAAEEGNDKKCLLKRFQITTKCVDVKMAEAYLDAAGGRLEEAVDAWRGDEGWVREQEERERRGKGIVSGRGMMWPW
jgi:hypothetical protein